MEIGGIQKTTLIDYPGRLAATVFLVGCNFRCPFCYASEIVLPEKIKAQPKISEKAFFSFLDEKKGLLDAVVVCGGEPTVNSDLPDFLLRVKKLGYLVKLDTNGSNPGMLKSLIKDSLVDYVALDVKAPKEKYAKTVGVDFDAGKIEESINILKNGKLDHEFRLTVVPTIHSKEDVVRIAKWIAFGKKFFLQGFRPEKTIDSGFEALKPYPKDFLLGIRKEISQYFEICEVRE